MDLPTIFTSWRGYCQRNHWLRGQYAKGILHYRSIGLLKKGWAALWRYYQSCLRRRTIVKTEDSGRKFYRRKILKKYYKELLLWWSHAQGVGKEWRRRYLLIKGLGIWIRSTLERQENKQRVTISKKIFLKKIWKSLQEHLLHSGVSWRADKDHMDLAAIFHQLVLCKIGLTRLSLYRSLTLRSSIHSKRHEVLQRQIQNKRKNSLFRAYRMMSHRAGMKRTRFLKLLKFHEQLAKEALSYWVSYGSKCSAQREVVISSDCYVRRRRQLLCLSILLYLLSLTSFQQSSFETTRALNAI